jgi:hypothetical protein
MMFDVPAPSRDDGLTAGYHVLLFSRCRFGSSAKPVIYLRLRTEMECNNAV